MTELYTHRQKPARLPFRATAMATAVAAGLGLSAQVFAQGLVLEEIVVTATKKQEVLSDVAETVNVVTGEKLDQFKVFTFEDVQTLTPGLTLRFIDPRNPAISMRGVPYDPDSNATEAVVTYWNGIPVRANVAFNQLFDIERIEVLRGPQGSLQGETSPSGSIQIHTKKGNPDVMEGQVRQTLDNNDGSVTDFGVSVPLIEGKLGMRVAGAYSDNELYGLKSVSNGKKASTDTRAGRLNLYWLPTDGLDASLTYEYLERDTDVLEAMEGSDQLGTGNPTLGRYDRTSLQDGSANVFMRNELVTLDVNYEIGEHTLTSLTGYQGIKNTALRDLDLGNIFPGLDRDQFVDSRFEIWTQELRLTNNNPDFWEYLIGAFYNHSESYTVNNNHDYRGFTYTPGTPPTPGGFGNPALLDSYTESLVQINRESYGLFADNKFYLTEDTTLQVGVRAQKVRQYRAVDTYAQRPLVTPGFTIPAGTYLAQGIPSNLQDVTSYAWTGTLKLLYDLNQDTTVYGSYGRGYRPGGATVSPTQNIDADLLIYDEENSDSIELGFKSVLDNGRYQVNGAIYYQMFNNFINRSANLFLDIDKNGTLETPILGGLNYNADAIVRGAELEGTALLTENWLVFAGISYNDAKFDGAKVPCGDNGDAADPGSQKRSCSADGRLGPEPNWSVNLSSEYTFYDTIAGADAYIRGQYRYTDTRADDFAAVNSNLYDGYQLGGYGVWDLYLGLRAPDTQWELTLWAKNLFDKEARTDIGYEEVNNGTNFAGGPSPLESGYSTVSVIPERTFGITGTYRFGGL
ncbi:MAG: TonB-dependent receptor [Spongiibacteraceae bacterium]|jgi:outer membrane receptor protein involved in Fe transport|nr:TonB-dependent receptor [Spongiibacteraceae bacterium]